jgi:hypothetical protein
MTPEERFKERACDIYYQLKKKLDAMGDRAESTTKDKLEHLRISLGLPEDKNGNK